MVQIEKQSYTCPANESLKSLCKCCKFFNETRYREVAHSKGYCEARKMILYRIDHAICLDFKEVIPEITKELNVS